MPSGNPSNSPSPEMSNPLPKSVIRRAMAKIGRGKPKIAFLSDKALRCCNCGLMVIKSGL